MTKVKPSWDVRLRTALRYIAVAQVAGDGASAVTGKTRLVGTTALIKISEVSRLFAEDFVLVESYDAYWDAIELTPAGWHAHFRNMYSEGGDETVEAMLVASHQWSITAAVGAASGRAS